MELDVFSLLMRWNSYLRCVSCAVMSFVLAVCTKYISLYNVFILCFAFRGSPPINLPPLCWEGRCQSRTAIPRSYFSIVAARSAEDQFILRVFLSPFEGGVASEDTIRPVPITADRETCSATERRCWRYCEPNQRSIVYPVMSKSSFSNSILGVGGVSLEICTPLIRTNLKFKVYSSSPTRKDRPQASCA
jgi:hypothetical protein